MRIELTGGWAEIRPVSEVTVRMAQPVQSVYRHAIIAGSADGGVINPDLISELNMAIILCMVQSWSYGEVTADSALDLQKDDFNTLADKCFEEYNATGEFGPTTDPKAPTDDSGDSN